MTGMTTEEPMLEALTEAREAIASLDGDVFGFVSDPHTGDPAYSVRDELLAKIDAALSCTPPVDQDEVERVAKAIEQSIGKQAEEQEAFFLPRADDDPTVTLDCEFDPLEVARDVIEALSRPTGA